MSKLALQLKPPRAGPQWLATGMPGSIRVKFDAESFALVAAVEVFQNDRSPQILGSRDSITLQTVPDGDGWVHLAAPSTTTGNTHVLVMGWMPVRPVRGGDRVPYSAPLELYRVSPQIDAIALQEAIDQLYAQSRDDLVRCLLELPAPMALSAPVAAAAPAVRATLLRPWDAMLETSWQSTYAKSVNEKTPAYSVATGSRLRDTVFAFASCQYPAGLLDHKPAGASINRLEASLTGSSSSPPLAALLLLGDQIYADATYGVLDPARHEDRYRQAYFGYDKALSRRHNVSEMARKGRLYVTPDDHEFGDNWEPSPDPDSATWTTLRHGLTAFDEERPGQLPPRQASGGYWGAVELGGGHEAFMLDTRTTRELRPWGPQVVISKPHILNAAQRSALEVWLLRRQQEEPEGSPVGPKFISSSVWLLPRLVGRAGSPDHSWALSDSWDGYPESLLWLLSFIAQQNIRGVVVLCGDAHLAGKTTVRLQTGNLQNTLNILHAPALYAPFPFANGQLHDYRAKDDFSWGCAPHHHTVEVDSALWALGDGYVRVSIALIAGSWQVDACFETGPATRRTETWKIE